MRTIVFLHSLSSNHVDRIRAMVPNWQIIHGNEKELWLSRLNEAEIVVGWNRTAADICLKSVTKLRWVQAWGAGVDRMPFDEFSRLGIVLTNASGVHSYPISETIFAMMLSLTRKVHLSIRHQTEGRWQGVGTLGEVHGKTIGIIGVGAIGLETARLAKAFGMKVLGVRHSGKPSEFVDRMYSARELDAVLKESDYVVVTVPLTKATHHMFGQVQFQMMKPSAFYINIGRGQTTDTDALINALTNGTISGAGLDVFEQEPLPGDSPLWTLENIIITPHNSGSTEYYEERAMNIFIQNLKEYLESKDPTINRVDLTQQY